MALFEGEPLVDVTTPDGRTIKLPRSLVPASLLPSQDVAPPPIAAAIPGGPGAPAPAPEIAAANGLPPPSVTNGALPTDASQTATPPVGARPDYVAGTAPDLTKPGALAASNKAFAKQQAAQDAAANSPDGQMKAAAGDIKQAYADEGKAAVQSGDIDAAGQLLVADAYKTRNHDLDKLFLQRQQQAQADLAEQNTKAAELETMRKKIANVKVDRSADHPILAAIGMAMAGLGSAMQHRYDGQTPDGVQTALKLMFESIDRKVAAQMADIDQKKQVLGLTKDELQNLKEKASSRLALNNLLISAESDRAARSIEEIAARTSSDKAKATAQTLAAQIRQKGAEKSADALQAQLMYDQRDKFQRQDIGYKYSALHEQGREADNELQVKREGIAADLEKALAAEHARGDAESMKQLFELQKDNETRGIGNVATGEPLLMKAGVDQMKKADAYEAEAKSLEASGALNQAQATRVQQLRDAAQQLRGEARIKYTFRERDPVQAGKVADQYNAGQQIVSLVDDIKNMYDDTGRSWVSTDEKRAAIQAKVTELTMQLKTAWQLGVLSKQDINTINTATGGDPTNGWNSGNVAHAFGLDLGEDPKAFKGRLDSLATGVIKTVHGKLRTDKYDGGEEDLFHRTTAPEASPVRKAISAIEQDKTPLERANDAEDAGSGVIKGSLHRSAYALGPVIGRAPTTPEGEASRAENSGSLKRPGLSNKQAAGVDEVLNQYQSGDKRAGDLIVQQAINTRPALSIALMHTLRDSAPELYKQARQGVAPEVAKQLDYEEKTTVGVSLTPTSMLVQQVLDNPNDKQASEELVRRATTGKDKEAQKSLTDIILKKNGRN